MRRLKFPIPISILLFVGLTLVGTYYVRRLVLEQALRSAFALGDEQMITELVKSWPSPVRVELDKEYTVLQWALWEGKAEMVKVCVENGARINAVGAPVPGCPWRMTPIQLAIYRERRDIVEILIAAGADVNAKDTNGETALHHAVEHRNSSVAELLRKYGAKE